MYNYSTISCDQNDNRRQIEVEQKKVRERMISMTYAVKTIDSRDDQELGVRTRRVVMGIKQIEREKQYLKRKVGQKTSIYTERLIRPLRCTSTLQVSNPSQSQISHQIDFTSQNPYQSSIPANLSSSNHSSLPKPTIPHKQFISKPLKVPSRPKVVKHQQNNPQIQLKNQEIKLMEKDQQKTISQDKLNNVNDNEVQNQQKENRFRRSKSSVENMRLKYEINAFKRKITLKSSKKQDEYINEPISARIHQNSCQQGQNHNIFSRNHFPSVLVASNTEHRISVSSLLTKYTPSIIESNQQSNIPLKSKLSLLLAKNMNFNLNALRQRTTKDKFSNVTNLKKAGEAQNKTQCPNCDKDAQIFGQDKFLRYSQVQQIMQKSQYKTLR